MPASGRRPDTEDRSAVQVVALTEARAKVEIEVTAVVPQAL